MTGKLWVGGIWAEITSVRFGDGVMHIEAVLGRDTYGEVNGLVKITGEDGLVVTTGVTEHRFGTKIAGSIWNIELRLDIRQLTVQEESATAREQF